jgi:hypothetical protein
MPLSATQVSTHTPLCRSGAASAAVTGRALLVLIGGSVGYWGLMHGGWLSASGDPKNAHLRRMEGASESLLLFKADMLDRDALAAAVSGCEGVFHVASPVPADKVLDPEASFCPTLRIGT